MTLFKTRADQTSRNARALSTEHLMADLGKRTASGGMIAVAAQGVKMVLQLTQAAILARLLAPEDFGIMAMAMTVTGFVSIFTDLGLSAATVQRKEIDQDTVSALFFMNIAMGLVVMLVCAAVAPAAAWFFGDPRVTWVVIGLAATIPLGAASAQHSALLTRGMRWVTIQWTGIFTQMIGMLVAVLLAWKTDLGYWALVASGWVTAIIGVALAWIVCPWRPSRVRNWQGAKSALNFGAYLTGFNFVNYFHRQLDNIVIGWRWGSVELGFYSRAYTLLTLPLSIVNGPVGSALVPALSRLQNDKPRWARALLESVALVTCIGCACAVLLICCAPALVYLLLGSKWMYSATILQALGWSMFAGSASNATGWIYISTGRTRQMLLWGIFASAAIAAMFLVAVEYGVVALSYSYSIMMFVQLVPCVYFACRGTAVSARAYLGRTLPFIAAGSLAAIAVLYAVRTMLGELGPTSTVTDALTTFLVAGVGAVLCYVALSWIFLGPAEARRLILSVNAKMRAGR